MIRVAAAVSPVPGGVGPITDAWVLHNTVLAARRWRAGAAGGARAVARPAEETWPARVRRAGMRTYSDPLQHACIAAAVVAPLVPTSGAACS